MGERGVPFWLTPHEIYRQLTQGPGSTPLDNGQEAARFLWGQEEQRAELIRMQAARIQSAWQGAAGDGAYGAAQPLATSALEGVDLLERSQDLLDRQSGSFHTAKNNVKPVPPEPPDLDGKDLGYILLDYEKDVTTYQADAQHNIDVFRGYDGASEYNQTRMPTEFSTPSNSGGTVSVTSGGTRPGDTGTYIQVPDTTQPRSGGEPRSGGDPGGIPVGGAPVSGPTPGTQQFQQTSPSDFAPSPVNTPGPLPPGQPTPVGPTPGGTAPGLPIGGFTGNSPGGVGGPGARGSGGPGGPGAAGRGGPGAGMRGALGAGPGVGALAAQEAAAQRAAASASARGGGQGMAGGAPMGAGRGKGDEDEEYRRKVLIEADAEGVFGSDVLTAPGVIGDDEYED